MSNPILLLESNYHLGDNPGVFLPSTYIGLKLSLPVTKTWVDDQQENVHFVIETTDVETWGSWSGHKVSVNGVEIGRLKDQDDNAGKSEIFDISLRRVDFLKLLGGSDSFVLEIELERQAAMPGFSDDFTIRRISTKNLALKIG